MNPLAVYHLFRKNKIMIILTQQSIQKTFSIFLILTLKIDSRWKWRSLYEYVILTITNHGTGNP